MKTLYPMDMEEFMMALGEDDLVKQIKKCFKPIRRFRLPCTMPQCSSTVSILWSAECQSA